MFLHLLEVEVQQHLLTHNATVLHSIARHMVLP